ncbi:MAG TPA: TetR family transcriptional regulator [Acidimicrobiales bacterium]|nr:TetR family transcriptional regulator [Acidimicrobiales bacterium]
MSVTAPVQSHRERKKLATRQAIHDAAFELVDRFGLSGTTIEAISDRAGVAPRTFWSYYASKEDAVIDRDPEAPAHLAVALMARPAEEDAMTALRCTLEEHIDARLVDSKRAVRRQQLIRREPQLMAAVAASFDDYERTLVAGVAQRLGTDPATDMRPGVLVAAASGASRVAQQKWADHKGRQPFPALMEEAFAALAAGLAPMLRKRAGR